MGVNKAETASVDGFFPSSIVGKERSECVVSSVKPRAEVRGTGETTQKCGGGIGDPQGWGGGLRPDAVGAQEQVGDTGQGFGGSSSLSGFLFFKEGIFSFFNLIYLFIFGCVLSSLLHTSLL